MKNSLLTAAALLIAAITTSACAGGATEGTSYGDDYGFDMGPDEDEDEGLNITATPIPAPHCGDGNVDLSEECDDGAENDDFGACTHECRINVCGDGLVYEGVEQCDEGEDLNGTDESTCNADCTLPV